MGSSGVRLFSLFLFLASGGSAWGASRGFFEPALEDAREVDLPLLMFEEAVRELGSVKIVDPPAENSGGVDKDAYISYSVYKNELSLPRALVNPQSGQIQSNHPLDLARLYHELFHVFLRARLRNDERIQRWFEYVAYLHFPDLTRPQRRDGLEEVYSVVVESVVAQCIQYRTQFRIQPTKAELRKLGFKTVDELYLDEYQGYYVGLMSRRLVYLPGIRLYPEEVRWLKSYVLEDKLCPGA